MATPKARINHFIKAPEVRVIDSDGKMLGVMKLSDALALANERQVDLVEISPNANPPVTKLLDYDKYRYQQEKTAQEARKKVKKITVKNLRLSVRIGDHDLGFKTKQAVEFLGEGNKVKIDIVMRGREQAHPELAFELAKKVQSLISLEYVVESRPNKMGNTVSMLLGPKTK
ncbi:MAG: translation initiation factor IF-3 [Candidatus Doudnabacteria bacterium]|nr:translation initiation factor IF-3 [Candidatus Doudnabacteria bacterium]